MKEEDILDTGFENNENRFFQTIAWWEKKRLIYNVLLLTVEVFVMIRHSEAVMRYTLDIAIVETILVNIMANMFYSAGWGLEVLSIYYFKGLEFSKTLKGFLFVSGTLFSLTLAWLMYETTLRYY